MVRVRLQGSGFRVCAITSPRRDGSISASATSRARAMVRVWWCEGRWLRVRVMLRVMIRV